MRDTFVWNLNDPVITPEIFAQSIVDDYALPSSYHSAITKAIQDQLSDFKAHSTTFGEDGVFVSSDTEDIQSGIIDGKEAATRPRSAALASHSAMASPCPASSADRIFAHACALGSVVQAVGAWVSRVHPARASAARPRAEESLRRRRRR
ncbi:hypothetical protein FOMPIDRAFT_1137574 [Fomitopsis schrenkii]|uniref:Uncharacterized protein n=1 Tax=Fomitopsis schrenkii TaxID=2126942 RepID=S8ES27_FOMSC|nr:hypothetical protein FOMPIDRAFT_1137574 [Fomitopsis schrenkii]